MLTAVLTFEAQLAQRCRLWVKFGSRPASLPTAFLSPALRNRPFSPASTPTSAMTCQRVKNHSSLAAWRERAEQQRVRAVTDSRFGAAAGLLESTECSTPYLPYDRQMFVDEHLRQPEPNSATSDKCISARCGIRLPAGIVGGGLGGTILGMLIPSLGAVAASKTGSSGIDIGTIIGQLAGGGVGGGTDGHHRRPTSHDGEVTRATHFWARSRA